MTDIRSDTIIDRLFDALAQGDLDVARDCFTPEARIWHGFDRIAHDPDSLLKEWQALIAAFCEREVHDIRRQEIASGYVQQHLMVMRRSGGPRIAWPVCIVVRIEAGRIARLDEYIDRAGSFSPPEGRLNTPGL